MGFTNALGCLSLLLIFVVLLPSTQFFQKYTVFAWANRSKLTLDLVASAVSKNNSSYKCNSDSINPG